MLKNSRDEISEGEYRRGPFVLYSDNFDRLIIRDNNRDYAVTMTREEAADITYARLHSHIELWGNFPS